MSPEDDACQPCPPNANCASDNVVQPNREYWHPYPCSVHMRECLSQSACDFDREAQLVAITRDMHDCDLNAATESAYAEEQCNEVSFSFS